ncbi:T9SS type A sorting domain-containing protein [Aureispira anguillae]|uniref:Omp28-related outer membrane protein n=1 Tax=Aureispira anguillae TaxID=2864201 RepID=A0A915YIP2_9BACT|nr:T9SS type A sorting domain-containing protein [Aureispira anguillae]BDS13889.1 Omp28-related outer membrane protein [Aureispira anguillae]
MKLKSLFTLLALATGASTVSAQNIVGTAATNKNVILEELTGKTCGYCPDGHKRAQQLYDANPGRIVLLNIHTGSYAAGTPNYRTGWGDYVGGLFNVTGYPTGAVNRRVMPNPTQSNPSNTSVMTSRGVWATNAATVMAEASAVNVGGSGTIDLDNRSLTLDVEAYYTAAGTGTSNKFHAIVTQDNIPGPQSGAAGNPSAILPNGDYNHQHMVRHNLSPNAGDDITTLTATSLYTNQYTHTFPADINNIAVNLGDLKVAVYVSEGASTGAIITGSEAALTFTTATALGASNAAGTLDASLGSVCGTSVDANMKITNTGSTALSTVTFQYVVNGGTPGTYQHTFTNPLQTAQYETVTIPAIPGLSPNGATSTVDLSITMLNGSANPNTNTSNGLTVATASSVSAGTTTVDFSITTDNYGSETDWALIDETTGATVMSGGGYPDVSGGQTYTDQGTIVDGHCYKLEVTDAYGDGICCQYGNGSFTLTAGSTVLSTGGSFTSAGGDKFVFDHVVGVVALGKSADAIKITPNPVHSNMTLEFTVAELSDLNISIMNALGQQVQQVSNDSYEGTNMIDVNTNNLASGVYFLNITSSKGTSTQRFVVEK